MPQSHDRATDSPFLLGNGNSARLSDYRGRWLVLYFYPKDNTPGCTLEGIDFNAHLDAFRAAGAEVLGVSRDSAKSHANFCGKHGFRFDLASDPDDALGNAFGVVGEKTLYGRKFIGVVRSTFLLDPQGHVVAQWRGVKVAGHAEAVLAELRRLQAGGESVLDKPGAAPAAPAKKAVAKKAAAKDAPPKRAATRKVGVEKTAVKKSTPTAARKTASKKATRRK
jgi:peroxiredoxin Q/BCP